MHSAISIHINPESAIEGQTLGGDGQCPAFEALRISNEDRTHDLNLYLGTDEVATIDRLIVMLTAARERVLARTAVPA